MLLPSKRPLEVIVRSQDRLIARCLIRRGRYVIGSERKNEIVLDEASISARHARLTVVSESEIYIEDFGSANGTYVDGQTAAGLTRVGFESEIQVGNCHLLFQRAGLPASVFEALPDGFLRTPRYRLGETVVQGRTSTIFDAHDTSLNRAIALKVMLPTSQVSASAVLRFIREAQITSQLQHSHIPPVYELSVDDQSQLFYTTRFFEGETLATLLTRLREDESAPSDSLSFARLISVFGHVCDAVAFAHAHGVVHNALRPECIMVGAFGETFVTGWGVARILPNAGEEEPASNENNTPRICAPEGEALPPLSPYSAPEQVTESLNEIGTHTDVYALGAILYRILTLEDPFPAEEERQLLEAILTGAITPYPNTDHHPLHHWPGGHLPEDLMEVAVHAMAMNREERHKSVTSLQESITRWHEGLSAHGEHGRLWKGVAGLLGRH